MERPDNKWDWVGSIETASGKYADLLALKEDQVDIDDIATSLSQICRFNGHLPSFYSVAEHCVRVAWWLIDNGQSSTVALTGLLHDASEAYVGDMMRPLKRLKEIETVFKPIEDHVMSVIHTVMGGVFPHPDIVHQADYEIYKWEVDNIRTGKVVGLSPDIAKELYLEVLTSLYLAEPYEKDHEVSEDTVPTRASFLNEVINLVDGDRNVQYGDPIDDFRRTAVYWSTHIGGVYRRKAHDLGIPLDDEVLHVLDHLIDPHDVAIMMTQLKDSRLSWTPYNKDSWLDKAGYSACGYDCVIRET